MCIQRDAGVRIKILPKEFQVACHTSSLIAATLSNCRWSLTSDHMQGTLDEETGKVEMSFYAQFNASMGGLYKASPDVHMRCMQETHTGAQAMHALLKIQCMQCLA